MSLPSLDSIETPAALVDEDRLEQDELWAVRGGQVVGRWDVTGRGRGLA